MRNSMAQSPTKSIMTRSSSPPGNSVGSKIRRKKRSTGGHSMHVGLRSNKVVLVPQSVEGARTWSEIWMSYRGFVFRGDQLLELRG